MTAGIDLRPDGAHVALVGARRSEVVGLGLAPYPPGTVVDGDVRRIDVARTAVRALLDRIHWSRPPSIVLTTPPIDQFDRRPHVVAPIIRTNEIGQVRAASRCVDTSLEVIHGIPVGAIQVDTVPTSVVRYAMAAGLNTNVLFGRGAVGGSRWTVWATNRSLEIEVGRSTEPGRTVELGPDYGLLRPPAWGTMAVSDPVLRAYPEPGRFTPAVGAALAGLDREPRIDLVGPLAQRVDSMSDGDWWGVETVS